MDGLLCGSGDDMPLLCMGDSGCGGDGLFAAVAVDLELTFVGKDHGNHVEAAVTVAE
jgi:hypothetical protein